MPSCPACPLPPRDLRNSLDSNQWTVPLIHGYWEQRVVSVFGRQITITLVARRSRHFAGTRFRKRGLNDLGQVGDGGQAGPLVCGLVLHRCA
jgi:hypothetical protein